ncbi:hypothetical protein HGRIS_006341 [Hohenbuehelia grisea]|uniref:MPN domain-containing protein n=1 Tax=Hohenbuehelia grisea TaxID=104357 RepID=A0ABR3K269_9AGAR
MVSYTFSSKAYLKLFFHAAKHPHRPVNGVLLGQKSTDASVSIVDAVPLLHHWTNLSPMMEIGLDLAGQYAESLGLKVVGYYQACERLDETALAPVGEKVASKIQSSFKDAVAFVVDGQRVGLGEVALIPYESTSTSTWRPNSAQNAAFTPDSPYKLADSRLPEQAAKYVREEQRHEQFGDFDDHLEDVSIDWLRNDKCLPGQL